MAPGGPTDLGGVAMTISLQRATDAGTPSIRHVDGSTAEPPGTYSPTRATAPKCARSHANTSLAA